MDDNTAVRILHECIDRGAPSARCHAIELEEVFAHAIRAIEALAKVRAEVERWRSLATAYAACDNNGSAKLEDCAARIEMMLGKQEG